jgi:hypothetical protein
MLLSKMMKQNVDHDKFFKFLSTNDNFYLEAYLKMQQQNSPTKEEGLIDAREIMLINKLR